MKKLFYTLILALAATTVSAQGIKIVKTDGTTIDVPASELNRIETYDATAEEHYDFEGTWRMQSLHPTPEYLNDTYLNTLTQLENWPELNTSDEITIADGIITPKLSSRLKNFFKGNATYKVMPDKMQYRRSTTLGDIVELTVLFVKGVNRNFDANNISQDDEAYIGLRLVEDDDADEAGVYMLELYLLDYMSTSFAPEYRELYYMYNEDKPMATITDVCIILTMAKADGGTSVRRKIAPTTVHDLTAFYNYINGHEYVMVYVTAPWSGPGNMIDAIMMQHMSSFPNTQLGYLRVILGDDTFSEQFASLYNIVTVPTTLFFHNGIVEDRISGVSQDIWTKMYQYISLADN